MDRSAHGHGLVGVYVFARLFAKQLFDLFLHLGHAGHAADQNHVMDVGHVHAGVFDRHAAGSNRALNQFFDQGFELSAGELDVQVFRAGGVCSDIGQVDIGLRAAGEFDLGFLSGFFEALQGQHVFGQVHALVFLELGDDEVDDALVKILATQKGVAIGGEHFELLFAIDVGNFDDGDVKRAAAQVIYRDLAVAFFVFVHSKGQGRGGGLVDDALDIQTGNTARVLGGLALSVVEIGRHGDHRVGHFFAQVVLGGLLHFSQDVGTDLLWRHAVTANFHPGVAVVGSGDFVRHQVDVLLHFFLRKLASDQALDRIQRVARVGNRLALGRGADQYFTVLLVGNDGRRRARALGVFDDLGRVALHDGDTAVGGAEVNSDDSSHDETPRNTIKLMVISSGQCPGFQVARRAICLSGRCEMDAGDLSGPVYLGAATVTSAGRKTRSAIK